MSSNSQLEPGAGPPLGHKGLCYHRTHKQPGRAAGMDGGGVHRRADNGRAFKRNADVFLPWYVLIASAAADNGKGVGGWGRGSEEASRGLFLRGA